MIYNISVMDLYSGQIPTPPEKTILIQIVDAGPNESEIAYAGPLKFADVVTLSFLDLEEDDPAFASYGISHDHANKIIDAISAAWLHGLHVCVQCTLGVSRSGAVVEFALREMGGIERPDPTYRNPNPTVLKYLYAARYDV